MRRGDLFLKAINTMLASGGGDPTSESFWALDEFLDFYEAETGEDLGRSELSDEHMEGLFWDYPEEFNTFMDHLEQMLK
jgi:hypothetical protein